MDTVEQDKFNKTINDLISSANSWDMIDKYFQENEEIKSIYEETLRECWNDQICGAASIYTATIDKLLERVKRN